MKPPLNSVPTLVSLLHPERNLPSAKNLTIGSEKILWWLGACGHEWENSLRLTALNPSCPYCSGVKALPNFNDLATTHPEIAARWHPTKNGKLNPQSVTFGSSKKVWWQCDKEHEWLRSIGEETKSKGCVYCSGRKILPGFNDLATTHPEIASEWNYLQNKDLTPENITHKNHQSIWWLGKCGHEWKTSAYERTVANSKCPTCRNRKIVSGFNDLATTHPEITAQWHPTKNGNLTPQTVSAGSAVRVWWSGDCGHEWETKILSRTDRRNIEIASCPVCINQKVVSGFNDLATTHPEIAAQWHPTKNGSLTPQTVSAGSNKKAWWICDKGHEWETTCQGRLSYSCHKCSIGFFISKAEKQLREYISTYGLKTIANDRDILQGKELDIYIPDKKTAIEFNGLHWHSEDNGKTQYYHYNKWKTCRDKGIQLIQIWEDDYKRSPELVKRMIAHKLGVFNEHKVFARNTIIREVTQSQVSEFLNNYHIQGSVSGGVRVGLFEKTIKLETITETLVAVIVLKREPGTNGKILNLLRYATSTSVIGGFTKLLKHVEKTYTPKSIVTFSDNCVSDGRLYKNNGFKAVKELRPDYMYIVKGVRVHKFNYRLKRFREDPDLEYKESLSERELSQFNKIPRIWDAGKIKWKKKIGYNQ